MKCITNAPNSYRNATVSGSPSTNTALGRSHLRSFPILTLLARAILLLSPTFACGENLIVNGGFEVAGSALLRPGDAGLAPWTIVAGDVEVTSSGVWPAYEGANSLDLTGNISGAIEQSFATTPGQSYAISFAYANSWGAPSSTANVRVLSVAPLLDEVIAHSGSTQSDMKWTLFEGLFTADSTISTLRFTNLTPDSFYGTTLDAVSVVAVPEPHTLAVACSGLMLVKRRSRWVARQHAID
jgi:choice-of-anchor C domain-containing protein